MNRFLSALLLRFGVLLFRARLHRVIMRLNAARPKVLLYHACEDEENDFIAGLRSNTTPSQFALHLEFLSKYYVIVTAADVARGSVPPRAAAITFDDGYRSVYCNAWPLLRARGMPATMFLVGDVVGNGCMVWLNELNGLLRGAPDAALAIAIRELELPDGCGIGDVLEAAVERYDPRSVHRLLEQLRSGLSIDATRLARDARLYLDWSEVAEMAERGFSFGAHTATHPNLERLDGDAQAVEMSAGRKVVEERTGRCAAFAYPFGRMSANSRQIALASGFAALFEVGGVNEATDPTRVARVPVYGRSEAELFSELEVVEPGKALLRRIARRLHQRRTLKTQRPCAASPQR